MSNIKYQIFISSTYIDLIEERRVVIEQVLNLGHIPVGMELFQAADESQWNYIKRRIDECDYYVVIVGERYGSEFRNKSYTQMEYEYAVRQKIPSAAFLLHPESRGNWPAKNVEADKREKIDAFRKKCQTKMTKYWRNSDDLGGKITTTVVELIRLRPRTGWIKADAIATPEALNELARLSEERRELQEKLADQKRQNLNADAIEKLDFAIAEGELIMQDFQASTANSKTPNYHYHDVYKWASGSANLVTSISPKMIDRVRFKEVELMGKNHEIFGVISRQILALKTLRSVGYILADDES